MWDPHRGKLLEIVCTGETFKHHLVRTAADGVETPDFRIVAGVLFFCDRLCMPDVENMKNEIMTEEHHTRYSMHPSNTKMQ